MKIICLPQQAMLATAMSEMNDNYTSNTCRMTNWQLLINI